MRSVHHIAFVLFCFAAASGCGAETGAPQPAATAGGEEMTWLTPQPLTIASSRVGDLSEQRSAWKQAGAKLDAGKTTNLDDLPKCHDM